MTIITEDTFHFLSSEITLTNETTGKTFEVNGTIKDGLAVSTFTLRSTGLYTVKAYSNEGDEYAGALVVCIK